MQWLYGEKETMSMSMNDRYHSILFLCRNMTVAHDLIMGQSNIVTSVTTVLYSISIMH